MNSNLRRIALTVFLLATAWAAVLLPQIDQLAGEQIEAGTQRAITTFAAARILNAGISVLQEFNISLGVTIAIGQALDPVNDLVEQFSSLMMAALVSFGIQKVLLAICSHWLVKVCTGMALLGVVLAIWMRWRLPRLSQAALIALLMIRFALPIAVLGSNAVFQHFSIVSYQSSQQEIHLAAESIQHQSDAARQQPDSPKPFSLIDRVKNAVTPPDFSAKLEKWKQKADGLLDHLVQLMVVFLLQTLLMPLFLLWLMLAGARWFLRDAARSTLALPSRIAP
ncbi:hypothetical protein [Roseateles sp.]|uniref:hypothetical protein n=1 Tax=Roseateles sp. TaxID=1971397 RepID=UPI003BA53C06